MPHVGYVMRKRQYLIYRKWMKKELQFDFFNIYIVKLINSFQNEAKLKGTQRKSQKETIINKTYKILPLLQASPFFVGHLIWSSFSKITIKNKLIIQFSSLTLSKGLHYHQYFIFIQLSILEVHFFFICYLHQPVGSYLSTLCLDISQTEIWVWNCVSGKPCFLPFPIEFKIIILSDPATEIFF